ncbi:hypothetical protein PRIPAC_79790 [Pristionchus pacificus]|uniref:Uncharacterized protein n=1 Tax=Pristionchus pacificus TaxID=54126 RepID=A0A2A6BHY4_PRIPA|nr:hypothetical protein PRIPAC_79790 [Pristionchus pacificus]|eukprot:PDM65502.1 hypothetical protein PRIPAC_52444 [Pristionchus pacificus]
MHQSTPVLHHSSMASGNFMAYSFVCGGTKESKRLVDECLEAGDFHYSKNEDSPKRSFRTNFRAVNRHRLILLGVNLFALTGIMYLIVQLMRVKFGCLSLANMRTEDKMAKLPFAAWNGFASSSINAYWQCRNREEEFSLLLLQMRGALVVVLALCSCAQARVKRQAYGYDAPVVAAAPIVATTAAPAAVLATAAPVAEWAAAFTTAAPVAAATVAPALPAAGWPAAAALAFPAGHPWATAAFRNPYAGYPAYDFPYGAAAAWPYGAAAVAAPRYFGAAAPAAAWPYGVPAAQSAAPYYGGFPYGQAAFGGASPYGVPAAGNFGFQGLPYQNSASYPWGLGGYNWAGSAAFPTVAAAAAAPAATIAPFPAGSEVSGANVTVSPVKADAKKD